MNDEPIVKGAYPWVIDLPGGIRAELAASNPPRYAAYGEMTDIDVTIPDDLRAAGWYWNGSFLCWRETPESCGIAVATCTFGIPGVFIQAREFERLRGEAHITSLEIRTKTKPTKKGKRELVQEEMSL